MTPLETLSVTVVPLTAVTPAVGSWSMTMPFGCVDATRLTATLKPSVCSFCTACGSCRPIEIGNGQPPARHEDRHRLPLAELRPGAWLLGEDDIRRAVARSSAGQHIEPLVVDLDRSLLLAQPDHVGDDGLVVTAAEEVPGEQTADDEQQQQYEPEPPVPLGRRPCRLGDLLLRDDGGGGEESPDQLVDAARTCAASARTVDPVEPGRLLVRGEGREPVARLWGTIERRCDVGRKLSASCHRPLLPVRRRTNRQSQADFLPMLAAPPTPLICIDPGHGTIPAIGRQTEPIGPGSSQLKIKDGGGTAGEAPVALAIALKTRALLKGDGYRVAMTRTGRTYAGGNIERARFCNVRHAALMIRIHADGSTDSVPARRQDTRPRVAPRLDGRHLCVELRAARKVQSAVVRQTRARDLGLVQRSDLTGFNWANVPAILVECGFMTNPAERASLAARARTS